MRDDLRAGDLIPNREPYSDLGYTFVGGGKERIATGSTVFDTTGNDAIVDWVIVELRSATDTVVASRAAFVQRDGDIVDIDGASPVTFGGIADGSYYVAVDHRNHLGVMTDAPIALTDTAVNVDFTDAATATWGTDSLWEVESGVWSLWAGDVNEDGNIKYQ